MWVIHTNLLYYDVMYLVNVFESKIVIMLLVVDVDADELDGEVGVTVLEDVAIFLEVVVGFLFIIVLVHHGLF